MGDPNKNPLLHDSTSDADSCAAFIKTNSTWKRLQFPDQPPRITECVDFVAVFFTLSCDCVDLS